MSTDMERLTEELEEYAIETNEFDVLVAELIAECVLESSWLAEHDATLIEAYQSQIRSTIGAFGDADGVWAFDSAVKTIEEARQRREEQS